MRLDTIRQWVDPAFRIVVGVGALAYGCGLVITNLYLRRFGTFSTSVANVQFVMSGLLFLFLLGLGYALWLAAIPRFRERGKSRGATIAARVGIIAVGALTVFNVIVFLEGYEDLLGWRTLGSIGVVLLIPGSFMIIEDYFK